MEDVKKKHINVGKAIGFCAYFGAVSTILRSILADGFSIAAPLAFSIAVFLSILSGYAFFVRGTANPWREDERQWTFLPWAMFGLISASVTFLLAQVFEF